MKTLRATGILSIGGITALAILAVPFSAPAAPSAPYVSRFPMVPAGAIQAAGHCGITASDLPRTPTAPCPSGQTHNEHCLDKARQERRQAVFAAYDEACIQENLADARFATCSGHAQDQYNRCIALGGTQVVCTQVLATYLQGCLNASDLAYAEADAQCRASVIAADGIFAAQAHACCQEP